MSFEEIKKGKNTILIGFDEFPLNPIEEMDYLSEMIFFGKYSHLGHKHDIDFGNEEFSDRFDFIQRGAKIIKRKLNAEFVIPIHAYIHSGMSISTSFEYPYNNRWDSGTLGFAVVTKQDIRDYFMIKRVTKKYAEKARKTIEKEVETLNAYICGNVYNFVIKNEEEEIIDSCCGFYDLEQCREEALLYA